MRALLPPDLCTHALTRLPDLPPNPTTAHLIKVFAPLYLTLAHAIDQSIALPSNLQTRFLQTDPLPIPNPSPPEIRLHELEALAPNENLLLVFLTTTPDTPAGHAILIPRQPTHLPGSAHLIVKLTQTPIHLYLSA